MTCASCGKSINPGDVVCFKCGVGMTQEGDNFKCSPCGNTVAVNEMKCEGCLRA